MNPKQFRRNLLDEFSPSHYTETGFLCSTKIAKPENKAAFLKRKKSSFFLQLSFSCPCGCADADFHGNPLRLSNSRLLRRRILPRHGFLLHLPFRSLMQWLLPHRHPLLSRPPSPLPLRIHLLPRCRKPMPHQPRLRCPRRLPRFFRHPHLLP